MTTVSNIAIRVLGEVTDEMKAETIVRETPRYMAVHIPALDETRYYDTAAVSDEQYFDIAEHGASQKLTDAAAGKEGEKAVEAVRKREATLWALTGTRGTLLDPVERAMWELALKALKALGEKTKNLPSMKNFAAWKETQDESFLTALHAEAEARVASETAMNAKLVKLVQK